MLSVSCCWFCRSIAITWQAPRPHGTAEHRRPQGTKRESADRGQVRVAVAVAGAGAGACVAVFFLLRCVVPYHLLLAVRVDILAVLPPLAHLHHTTANDPPLSHPHQSHQPHHQHQPAAPHHPSPTTSLNGAHRPHPQHLSQRGPPSCPTILSPLPPPVFPSTSHPALAPSRPAPPSTTLSPPPNNLSRHSTVWEGLFFLLQRYGNRTGKCAVWDCKLGMNCEKHGKCIALGFAEWEALTDGSMGF